MSYYIIEIPESTIVFDKWSWVRCIIHTITIEVPKPAPIGYPEIIETLSDRMRAARLDSQLLQRELAEIIGVTCQTIESWELKRNCISKKHLQIVKDYVAKASA